MLSATPQCSIETSGAFPCIILPLPHTIPSPFLHDCSSLALFSHVLREPFSPRPLLTPPPPHLADVLSGIGHGDLRRFVGVKPYFTFACLQHACSQALLDAEVHHCEACGNTGKKKDIREGSGSDGSPGGWKNEWS